jgi:DNA repair protein SbcC/Rad50
MHLNSLAMRNFKKYRRAEVIFEDGLTGIVGNNGVGKSTIVEAIAWALYGSKASSIKRELLKNTCAKDSEMVEVRLNLGLGKQELSVYRAMKGKNLVPDASLCLDGLIIASSSKEVDQRLEDILKINYHDFMKTFYSRQKDLDNLLKETSMGKREYFLKLLGLEEIRERAIELIKQDKGLLEMEKRWLEGALGEIGDIEKKIEIALGDITRAQTNLTISRQKEAELSTIANERKHILDIQSEKKLKHDLLAEKAKMVGSMTLERKETIAVEKKRLEEIETSRKLMTDLDPKLGRLKQVKTRLEILESRRKKYEELYRDLVGAKARLEGTRRLLQDSDHRLASLQKDRSVFERLEPIEKEYSYVEIKFQKLEALRDEFLGLRGKLDGLKIRLDQEDFVIAKLERVVSDLTNASIRHEEIRPLVEKHEILQRELAEAIYLKDMQRQLNDLESRKGALQERREGLTMQIAKVRHDMAALGDLAAQETKLRDQDKELDMLSSELNNILADLKGDLAAQESARSEANLNLSRLSSLGLEGKCPACERPLGEQYSLLHSKYERAINEAMEKKSAIIGEIQIQKEKLDGVALSRSAFKKAFDELNTRKSRKAELLGSWRGLQDQIAEAEKGLKDLIATIEKLGEIRFDAQRFEYLQKELDTLRPILGEYSNLSIKLEDLPNRVTELDSSRKKKQELGLMVEELSTRIETMGYSEDEYNSAKNRLLELKPDHDSFCVISPRIQEIPSLQEKVAAQEKDLRKLQESANSLQSSLKGLDFDPSEHELLMEEQKNLLKFEEEAHRLIIKIASEPEILKRLKDAAEGLARAESELMRIGDQLNSLDYSEKYHITARESLDESELALGIARKDASDNEIKLKVLEEESMRLKSEKERKIENERKLCSCVRQLEVADTAKSSISKFMDKVLIRVKDDIARTAGEILEDLSGKYSVVKIDDDFNILVEEGGNFYPISRYSGGETDMIAISVRVAISEYLMRFGHERQSYSFLILDEIFGSQDREHRENMINMLRKLEDRFPQILAISHISDVQGQFDATLQVIEDELGNSRIEIL